MEDWSWLASEDAEVRSKNCGFNDTHFSLCKNANEFPENTKSSQDITTEGRRGVITVLFPIVPLCIVSLLVPVNTSVISPAGI